MFRFALAIMLAAASASTFPSETQMWLRLARAEVADLRQQKLAASVSSSRTPKALLAAARSRTLPPEQLAALPPEVAAELSRLRSERDTAKAQLAVGGAPAAVGAAGPGVSPMMSASLFGPGLVGAPGAAAPGAALAMAPGTMPISFAPAPAPALPPTTTPRPIMEQLLPIVAVDAKLVEASVQDLSLSMASMQNRLNLMKQQLSSLTAGSTALKEGAQNDTNLANDNKAAFAKLEPVIAEKVLDHKLNLKRDYINQTRAKIESVKGKMGNLSKDVLEEMDETKFKLYAKEPKIQQRVDAVHHGEDLARLDVPEYVDRTVEKAVTNMVRAMQNRLALNLGGPSAPAPAPALFLAPGSAMMMPGSAPAGVPVLIR